MDTGTLKVTVKMLAPIAWLAFAAGLQMLGALLFFKASVDLILISTCFFITFGVYMLNRFTDEEDGYNYPEQKLFFQNKSVLMAIPVILLGISLLLLLVTGRLVTWHIILIALGILYSVSVIPFIRHKSLCFIRLKDIFFIKNIIVSLLWGITPFALAASQKNAILPGKADLLIAVAAFCLTTFITAVAYDVPDAEGDRHAGILTITTRFGIKFTRQFLLLIGMIGCLSVVTLYLLGKTGIPAMVLFFANVLWTTVVTVPVFIERKNLLNAYSKPLLDSQCVFCGFSLIIFSLF